MRFVFVLACLAILLLPNTAVAFEPLPYNVVRDAATEGFDGDFCWFHPRAGVLPGQGEDGKNAVVMTLQKWFLSASDYFSGLSTMRTDDLGKTWTGPAESPGLAWREEEGGITVGVCDFTPGWHAPTKTLLGVGHTVRYKDGHLMRDPRPREFAYAVFDAEEGAWAPWDIVALPDRDHYFSYGPGCAQWLVEDDGTLLVPFYHKSKNSKIYASSVMRLTFDGEKLHMQGIGPPLEHDVPRGYYEPSLTRFQDKYYMTIRNDKRGYVSHSDDGLHFAEPKPWRFDDGEELGSYNTQQHWVTHSDGLFLAYTRRGADNDHIMRHRAPLFIAQVDPARLCVVRETEKVLVPERGARLGNFGVVTVNANESWVTVGEGMYGADITESDANGRVWVSRVLWSKPNRSGLLAPPP